MKDLLLYVADADALGFMKSMLCRDRALGIRRVSFDIERHPLGDSGMVQSGAELARMKKGAYSKALLMWDHHGSGRDHRHSSREVAADMQEKLDRFTWKEQSAVVIFVPELEQWLWFCEKALHGHYGVTETELQGWVEEFSRKSATPVESLKREQPKELFEFVVRDRLRRTISPRDFEDIGFRAGVKGLMLCDTFLAVVTILQEWFPQ